MLNLDLLVKMAPCIKIQCLHHCPWCTDDASCQQLGSRLATANFEQTMNKEKRSRLVPRMGGSTDVSSTRWVQHAVLHGLKGMSIWPYNKLDWVHHTYWMHGHARGCWCRGNDYCPNEGLMHGAALRMKVMMWHDACDISHLWYGSTYQHRLGMAGQPAKHTSMCMCM